MWVRLRTEACEGFNANQMKPAAQSFTSQRGSSHSHPCNNNDLIWCRVLNNTQKYLRSSRLILGVLVAVNKSLLSTRNNDTPRSSQILDPDSQLKNVRGATASNTRFLIFLGPVFSKMAFNASFFNELADIFSKQDGYQLAQTLSPDIPTEELRKICRSHNAHSIKGALKRGLHALTVDLDTQEVQGWTEVYAAYWNATGVILAARDSSSDVSRVSAFPCPSLGFSYSSFLGRH